jgi:predicted RNA-binding Zn-ribbon protein involved in translation (DUF1610 family)
MAGHMCRQCGKYAVYEAHGVWYLCNLCGAKYKRGMDLPHNGQATSTEEFDWCPWCGKRALVGEECSEERWQFECENCGKDTAPEDYMWALFAVVGDRMEALLPRVREHLEK